MKKLLTALLASAALLAAVPATASAHENDQDGYYNRGNYGNEWNRGDRGGYNNLRGEFQHLYGNVEHGMRDGSLSRREARQFFWAINGLRQRLDFYWRNDGRLDRRERWDMQRRLERLHADIHDAHANGHAERDYGYYGDQGGYGDQYGGYERDGGYRR